MVDEHLSIAVADAGQNASVVLIVKLIVKKDLKRLK